jgi:hypothetical protein
MSTCRLVRRVRLNLRRRSPRWRSVLSGGPAPRKAVRQVRALYSSMGTIDELHLSSVAEEDTRT